MQQGPRTMEYFKHLMYPTHGVKNAFSVYITRVTHILTDPILQVPTWDQNDGQISGSIVN